MGESSRYGECVSILLSHPFIYHLQDGRAMYNRRYDKTNPMGLSTDTCSNWKTETHGAMERSATSYQRVGDASLDVTAGVKSPSPEHIPPPANFAWPASHRKKSCWCHPSLQFALNYSVIAGTRRVLGDFSNAHTEYRDSYHEWALGKAASSARPVDRNPMGLSVDALDASAWKSESRQAMEHSADSSLDRDASHVAGTVSALKTEPKSPTNFAWPVPEGTLVMLFPFSRCI